MQVLAGWPRNISPEEDGCVGSWGGLPGNISLRLHWWLGGGALLGNVKLVLELPKLNVMG